MKRKKKLIFLPVVMAAILMLGACNNSSSNSGNNSDNTSQNNNDNPVTTFTVSFGANGGSGTMADVPNISGEYTLPACTFTAPEGKHFAGWKVDGQGNLLAVGAKINVTANVQLVAQWEITTYVVSFGANGGSGTMADVANVVGEYTLPACTFTAPEGKQFAGWKVNGQGDLLAAGGKITVSANTQLVAQWEDIPVVTFTISFDANGGTGTMANVPEIAGAYALPACAFVAPEGKEFVGWKVNGQGETLAAGETIQVTANVQLVAQWQLITYTVSFGANGGTGEMANVANVVGDYELPACTLTAPENKEFVGWKVNGEGEALAAGETIQVTANVQLVAQWELVKHSVTFKVGNEVYGDIQHIPHGGKVVKPADPTKPGDAQNAKYRFIGWDKDLDAAINEDTVVNAKFVEYEAEMMVDDFEAYTDSESVIDAGWVALGYDNESKTWTDNTKAAVSLGTRSVEGEKALRFDAWQNKVTYKFAKEFEENQFAKDANALQIRLMAPRGLNVNVLFTANADVIDAETQQVKNYDVEFQYKFTVATGEYVQYTIPLSDSNWKAWGDEGKTIKVLANAIGLHEDDILKTAKKVEFSLTGDDGGTGASYVAFLDSMKFVTLDNPQRSNIETIETFTKYTGYANNGKIIKFEMGQNGAATASVIDAETPINIPGHIALQGQDITFTSDDDGASLVLNGHITQGGKEIQCPTASGAYKAAVQGMKFTAIQTVDNFEGYATDGQAYYQSGAIDARSGCRGAYFSEYYAGSGSSPWGGNGWSLMGGSGDQLKLKSDGGGHNSSSKYLCLKNSKDNGMRFMQWGLFDGSSEQKSYRGSKLGFWARSYERVPEFTISMYSQSKPTASTKDNDVKKLVVTPSAQLGSWTHYEIDLDPNRVYYGFMIFMEKNLVKESFLYLDDIEVYGANPYATYVAPTPIEIEQGALYSAAINNLFRTELKIVDEDDLTINVPGLGMNISGTYALEGNEFTATLAGGTVYKATVSQDARSLTFKSVEGGADQVRGALNKLSFGKSLMLEDAESYTDSGKMYYQGNTDESQASGARGAYYCDYYSGGSGSTIGGSGWSMMGGSGDQLSLVKDDGALGSSQSLSLKRGGNGMRYLQWNLYKGNTVAHRGYKRLVVYLKNTGAYDITVKLYAFKNYKVTSGNLTNRAEAEYKVPKNSDWSPYTVILDANTSYYGYGIYVDKLADTAATYLRMDNVYLDTAVGDYNYGIKANAVLEGNFTANDTDLPATIKFLDNKQVAITCTAMSLNNFKCNYTMWKNGSNQMMKITIKHADSVFTYITGVYAIDNTGKITFTVTAASGQAAANVKIDEVFTLQ